MRNEAPIRERLRRLQEWEDAHVGFDAAVADIPETHRGRQPPGLPHSLWQLVEHLRRAQHDILEFCLNSDYEELTWPDDYWPSSPEPPSPEAWNDSVERYRADRTALQDLADTTVELADRIPHGSGQTHMRELLLAADHAAYHVGQIVLVRRALGIWTTG